MRKRILISLLPLCLSVNLALGQTLEITDHSDPNYLLSQNVTMISYYISTTEGGPPLENIRIGCAAPGGAAGVKFSVPIPDDAALDAQYYIVAWNCTPESSPNAFNGETSAGFNLLSRSNLSASCQLQNDGGISLSCPTPAH